MIYCDRDGKYPDGRSKILSFQSSLSRTDRLLFEKKYIHVFVKIKVMISFFPRLIDTCRRIERPRPISQWTRVGVNSDWYLTKSKNVEPLSGLVWTETNSYNQMIAHTVLCPLCCFTHIQNVTYFRTLYTTIKNTQLHVVPKCFLNDSPRSSSRNPKSTSTWKKMKPSTNFVGIGCYEKSLCHWPLTYCSKRYFLLKHEWYVPAHCNATEPINKCN